MAQVAFAGFGWKIGLTIPGLPDLPGGNPAILQKGHLCVIGSASMLAGWFLFSIGYQFFFFLFSVSRRPKGKPPIVIFGGWGETRHTLAGRRVP